MKNKLFGLYLRNLRISLIINRFFHFQDRRALSTYAQGSSVRKRDTKYVHRLVCEKTSATGLPYRHRLQRNEWFPSNISQQPHCRTRLHSVVTASRRNRAYYIVLSNVSLCTMTQIYTKVRRRSADKSQGVAQTSQTAGPNQLLAEN